MSSSKDNSVANKLYESFFPSQKKEKRSCHSLVAVTGGKAAENTDMINVQIKNHGGAACIAD